MRLARGFSLIELLVVILVVVVAAALLLPSLGGSRRSPQLKDSTQVRSIHQAMVIWAQNGQDEFPIPSQIDKLNWTVPEEGKAKDTTANIYSCMVFNGMLSPEMLVSPLETNRNVRPYESYEYQNPTGALDPAHAQWDPKFCVELDGSKPGNASYAHMQVCAGRRRIWTNSFTQTEMVVGTRGPEIASVQKNPDGSVTPTLANPRSNTLRFFGKGRTWSGNMAFNDNHVDFLKDWLEPGKPFPTSRERLYKAADGRKWPDIWCYDEPDDPDSTNDYMGIFTKAGATPKDYKAVWD